MKRDLIVEEVRRVRQQIEGHLRRVQAAPGLQLVRRHRQPAFEPAGIAARETTPAA